MTGGRRKGNRWRVSLLFTVLLLIAAIVPASAQSEIYPAWNYPTGSEIREIAVSPDGTHFAVGSTDHTVYGFTREGKLLWSYMTGDVVNSVAIASHGQYVAAGSQDKKVYYFTREGRLLWSFPANDVVKSVAVSADGQLVVAGSRDRTVMVFSVEGTPLWSFTTGSYVDAVAVSADGKYVAAGAWDKNIYYFTNDGSLLWTFTTGGEEVKRILLSSDGQFLAAASTDNTVYYLTGKGKLVWNYKINSLVNDIALSRDGQFLVAGALDRQVYLLNREGKLVWNYAVGNSVQAVAVSDNGQNIVAGSQDNKVYSFGNDGSLVWTASAGAPISNIGISANGQSVVAGSTTGIVYLFNNLAIPRPTPTVTEDTVTGIVASPPIPLIAGVIIIILVLGGVFFFHLRRIRKEEGVQDTSGTAPARVAGLKPLEKIPSEWWVAQLPAGSDIELPILDSVLEIAIAIAREGREGKPVGTAFLVGDAENVMSKSRQLIKNPVEGHAPEERLITNPDQTEYIKEMAQLDGAFVISGNGLIEAIGRRITVDTSDVHLPEGYGTRHASVAGMTQATGSIGIVVSQSGGKIAILQDGKIVKVLDP
jgi:hypothetical protein